MKDKRNLLKIIFFASTFSLITNTSSVYSENLHKKCSRILGFDPDSWIGKNLWNKCGLKLMNNGDLWGASAVYGKAIMTNPYSEIPHYNLGIVKQRLGDQKGAIESYTRALTLNPMYGR